MTGFKDLTEREDKRGSAGPVAVAATLDRVTRPLFGRRGFAGGALIADWPAIVGTAMAAHTQPLKIDFPKGERSGGVLVVRVGSSAFAPQLQHLEPLVVERVNRHFGYGAVARIKIRQGPVVVRPKPSAPPPPGPLSPDGAASLDKVEDADLRAALEGLARRLGR